MAFTKTMTNKKVDNYGHTVEEGTWTMTSGDSTGTITADTTQQPEIVSVDEFFFTNDANHNIAVAKTSPVALFLTATANDTGTYRIKGFSA
jgi:hypothetical protein